MPSDRVVVHLKSYLGDAVMATPLIDLLADSGRPLAIVSSPTVLDLLAADGRPFERFPTGNRNKLSEMVREGLELRKLGAGAAIVVNRSFRSALTARLSGAKVRVGHATDGRSFLLTAACPYDQDAYEAHCYTQLARLAGFDAPAAAVRLAPTDVEVAAGKKLAAGATVAVQAGNRHIERQVPIAVMAEVVRALHRAGEKVVVMGGPDDRDSAAALADRSGEPIVDLVGKTSIRETMGVLANLRWTVGGVAGLMHVAVGVGCPTTMAFGSSSGKPSKWAHRFGPHRYVEAPGGDMVRIAAEALLESAPAPIAAK